MKQLTSAILLVGSPEKTPDIRYVTSFSAPDPVVVLAQRNQTHLIVSQLEFERARRTVRNATVWTPDLLGISKENRGRLGEWVVGLMKRLRIRTVRVPADFPLGVERRLAAQHWRVVVSDLPLFPGRQIKSKIEIRMISACQQAAVAAMRRAVEWISAAKIGPAATLMWARKPLTAERVKREIQQVLMDRECSGIGAIVAGGRQGADPHERGTGPLRAHQPIVIDIFPQSDVNGYWGDLTRTVVKGPASDMVYRMQAAVQAAQTAALNMIKEGVMASAVHQRVVDTLEQHGFKTGPLKGKIQGFIHSTGHGIGLEVHEGPGLGWRKEPLKAGHVVTVEPGLYYFEHGGLRIEDTVLVTRHGYQILEPCEPFFEV